MAYTTSPNMNLIIPGVGTEPGPTYASDINNSLTIIDQHDHTLGHGVQITPAAINISSNLTFNSNALTSLSFLNFTAQTSAPSKVLSLYTVGNELYFEDGIGNDVQITKSGTVNVVSSGISNGTASASFVTGVLVVDSATNTPANIQAGSLLMGNSVANSPYLTLQPPTLSSNYTLTLPTVPAQTNVVVLDSSGNLGSVTYNTILASANNPTIGGTVVYIGNYAIPTVTGLTGRTPGIVVGVVNADGTYNEGNGFSCSRTSTGTYSLTFSPGFQVVPIITGATIASSNLFSIQSVTNTSAVILIANGTQNSVFNFIAIG